MNTSGVNTSAAVGTIGPSSAEPQGSSALGKDQFVELLMSQMTNQDPTSPMDSQDFVAQLAQFATVELMTTQASQLDSLILAQAANNQTAVASLVGSEVSFASDKVTIKGDSGANIAAELSEEASSVTVTIKDEDGNTVRTMQLGAQSAGDLDVQWDGLDDDGNPVTDGDYTVSVTANDKDGNAVDTAVRQSGHVDGISFENGYPELLIGDRRVSLSDVIDIRESDGSADDTGDGASDS